MLEQDGWIADVAKALGVLAVLAYIVLGTGCAVRYGPSGGVAFATSTYSHQATENADGSTSWTTNISRPWGTSSNEYYIDSQQESGSVAGDGLSDNMSDTLGKDLGGKAIDAAVTATGYGAAGQALRDLSARRAPVTIVPEEVR